MSNPEELLSVQFGCGCIAPEAWLNFDVSPTLRLSKIPGLQKLLHLPPWPPQVRYGNVVQGLPVPDGSCRRLFSDNMLEHLSLADAKRTLANCRKILAPEGVFRLFLPDMHAHVETYLSLRKSSPAEAAHKFMQLMAVGLTERERGLKGMLRRWLGNSRHLWMWDEAAMKAALTEAGFGTIRRARYLDSGDPMFNQIESTHPEWADYVLGVEARC
jgi:hypothetical protein